VEGPHLVELITTSLVNPQRAGHALRRSTAVAQQREGVPAKRIADLFGVSPQRISTILSEGRGDP